MEKQKNSNSLIQRIIDKILLGAKHKWQNISNKFSENGFLGNGKFIVSVASIISLLFINVHVSAVNLLTNQYIGVTVFCFILFGLVALFNSSRTKDTNSFSYYLTLVVILVTIGFGIRVNLMINSEYARVKVQSPDEFINITKEQIFTIVCMSMYGIGFLSILASKFLTKKK